MDRLTENQTSKVARERVDKHHKLLQQRLRHVFDRQESPKAHVNRKPISPMDMAKAHSVRRHMGGMWGANVKPRPPVYARNVLGKFTSYQVAPIYERYASNTVVGEQGALSKRLSERRDGPNMAQDKPTA